MKDSYKTAIDRDKPSTPMRWLEENNLLGGKFDRKLDYGCGRGFDADYYNMIGYDPHFRPKLPTGKFRIIVCNYVLNVVSQLEANFILYNIRALLVESGVAYITVRRDIKVDGLTDKGTYQRNVKLDLPKVNEIEDEYCIYKMEK
jgi:hypothetical protein